MPGTIVIGVDLSDCSRRAFDAGVGLALDLKANVLVVHAFEPGAIGLGIAGGAIHRDIEQSMLIADEEEARKLTADWLEDARRRGAQVAIHAETTDDPSRLVLAKAKEVDAALIVVGTHGRRGLSRLLMGSVAEKLVRHADRPVLVVPSG